MPAGHPQNFLGDSLGLRGGLVTFTVMHHGLSIIGEWCYFCHMLWFGTWRYLINIDKLMNSVRTEEWCRNDTMEYIHLDCEEPLTLKLHLAALEILDVVSAISMVLPAQSNSFRQRFLPRKRSMTAKALSLSWNLEMRWIPHWRTFFEGFNCWKMGSRWRCGTFWNMFRSTWSSWSSAERDAPAPRGIARGIVFGLASGDAAGAAGKPCDRFWVWIVAKRI